MCADRSVPVLVVVLICLVCLATASGLSQEDSGVGRPIHFLLEAYPSGTLYSPELAEFDLEADKSGDDLFRSFSSLPTLKIGIGYETDSAFLDASVGGGALINSDFVSPQVRGDVAVRFKLGELFTLGPHVGGIYFAEPTWFRDVDTDFSDSVGIVAGVGFTVGTRDMSVCFALDYLTGAYAVRSRDSPQRGQKLDFSGLLLHVGVIFRF